MFTTPQDIKVKCFVHTEKKIDKDMLKKKELC